MKPHSAAHLARGALLAVGVLLTACGERAGEEGDTSAFDEAEVIARSEPLAAEFQSLLQSELKAALSAGGPSEAVAVCHEAAPAIAAMQSEQSGALIRRIADRNRNPGAAVPADLRIAYDQLAKEPLRKGRPATAVVQTGNGENGEVHYLSAIPMREQPCSTCHGSAIEPAVKTQIDALYPQDAATGFAAGELRGALVITWPIAPFDE